VAIRDSTLGQVVGTHFDGHPITRKGRKKTVAGKKGVKG
jgi:hypothetical protein